MVHVPPASVVVYVGSGFYHQGFLVKYDPINELCILDRAVGARRRKNGKGDWTDLANWGPPLEEWKLQAPVVRIHLTGAVTLTYCTDKATQAWAAYKEQYERPN
jgi:hypothetical protein